MLDASDGQHGDSRRVCFFARHLTRKVQNHGGCMPVLVWLFVVVFVVPIFLLMWRIPISTVTDFWTLTPAVKNP